jgi:hypothetical protein
MGGGSSRALMQGNRWLFVGENGARLSTQFAWHGREGNRWLEFRIPCANAFTGPLPWPTHGARALPSVSCVAYWNEQRALGFCRGPFVFRGSQGPGKGRIEALFTIHARPSAKQKNAVDRGGAPGGACAVSTFQRLRARAAAAMQRVTPSI